jgi:hypothetical protein
MYTATYNLALNALGRDYAVSKALLGGGGGVEGRG